MHLPIAAVAFPDLAAPLRNSAYLGRLSMRRIASLGINNYRFKA
jgi:hypothetical protein